MSEPQDLTHAHDESDFTEPQDIGWWDETPFLELRRLRRTIEAALRATVGPIFEDDPIVLDRIEEGFDILLVNLAITMQEMVSEMRNRLQDRHHAGGDERESQ